MKRKLLVAVVAILALGTAYAAEEKAAEPKADSAGEAKKPMPKKKMKTHSHMEEKTGMPASSTHEEKAAGEAKKPIHEHRKEHKTSTANSIPGLAGNAVLDKEQEGT